MVKVAVMKQELWFSRLIRGLRLDGNPLRRASDRLEACLLGGLFAASLAAAPFAAQAAFHWAYAGALRAGHAQEAARHQVRAELVQPAAGSTVTDSYGTQVAAQARWTSVTGVVRTGEVMARAGSPEGTTLTVWTDASGALASPPPQPGQASAQADEAAGGAVAGIGVLYLGGAAVVRLVLHRRRMAAWEADWTLTEPTWNRRSR
jgi:hypothetical protein